MLAQLMTFDLNLNVVFFGIVIYLVSLNIKVPLPIE